MAEAAEKSGDTVIIKKYANRRLYNTRSSSYITLDHLAKMTRENVDYKVLDAKTGADITHQILTQIIMEEESSGEQMLPVSFLRQLISMYGNSMQSLIPHYLEASMDNFRNNQVKLHKAFEDSLGNNPLARLPSRTWRCSRPRRRPSCQAPPSPTPRPRQATTPATNSPPCVSRWPRCRRSWIRLADNLGR